MSVLLLLLFVVACVGAAIVVVAAAVCGVVDVCGVVVVAVTVVDVVIVVAGAGVAVVGTFWVHPGQDIVIEKYKLYTIEVDSGTEVYATYVGVTG